MATTVLYMSMSLDGYIAGPNEGPDNGLGDGGMRLHEWIFAGAPSEEGGLPAHPAGVDGEIVAGFMTSRAIVAGRQTFELAGGWGGDHHDEVPIFVYSRTAAPPEYAELPLVTYLDDVAEAIARARAAAGDGEVLVHGAATAQLALAAGALDELQIHLIPVLLGDGRRLFEDPAPEQVELEPVRVLEGEGATHIRYRVRR